MAAWAARSKLGFSLGGSDGYFGSTAYFVAGSISLESQAPAIWLGSISEKQAQRAKVFIEDLLDARKSGLRPEPAAIAWLRSVHADVRAKVIEHGLIDRSLVRDVNGADATTKAFMDAFILNRTGYRKVGS